MRISILTDFRRLQQRYGAEGFNRFSAALGELVNAMEEEGNEARVVSLEGRRLRRSERRSDFLEVLRDPSGPPDQVLILGDDEVIPFCKVRDPYGVHSSEWRWILSDSFEFFHLASMRYNGPGIGRMPAESGAGPELLISQIHRAIKVHREGKLSLDEASHCFCAEAWQDRAVEVFSRWCTGRGRRSVHVSPPVGLRRGVRVSETTDPTWLSRSSLLLFELHGGPEVAEWWGEESATNDPIPPWCLTVIDPALAQRSQPEGSVVCAATCWSADIKGKRRSQSIALQLLGQGAACFIGLTHFGYDYPEKRGLNGLDLLFAMIVERLRLGIPTGQAIGEAKNAYVRAVGNLLPTDKAMLLSLTLLGDPTLRLAQKPEGRPVARGH
ncbi:MAG: C25 family cysteine peptidase [candidate division WOR-3 bacterium]